MRNEFRVASSMSSSHGKQEKTWRTSRPEAGKLRFLLSALVLAVLLVTLGLAVDRASADTGVTIPMPTNTVEPTLVPESPTPSAPEGAGWEQAALLDLAELLGWPPAVSRDSAGRLMVQHVITGTEWSRASVRPFAFRAAAEAAFGAEQEDARLAGYTVVLDRFSSYPAYWASIADSTGNVIERRLHWQADSWILGVDIRSQAPRISEIESISASLLLFCQQYGLPGPPEGGPTSTPATQATPVLPSPSPTAHATPCAVDFEDVQEGYWAFEFVQQLACRGVVSGYADGTFRPQNPTSRGQLVKMVVLSQGWRLEKPRTPTFPDVPADHTFFRYVETAVAKGLVNGYADGTFRPDDYVTRAQVAKILTLANDWPTPGIPVALLCDVPRDHWAWAYVQSALLKGVFTGYADGCFYPDAMATRAQLAKVLVLSQH